MLVQKGAIWGKPQLENSYSNFVNSIDSEQTRQVYEYTLSQFLNHYSLELDTFLRLEPAEISRYIVNYLVEKKISRQYKVVIFSAIKHACEMNEYVKRYLGFTNSSLKIRENFKVRNIYKMLEENPNVKKMQEKPVVLQWFDVLCDVCDPCDVEKTKDSEKIPEKIDENTGEKNTTVSFSNYNLKKDQTSYSDLLDALRLALKGYQIN